MTQEQIYKCNWTDIRWKTSPVWTRPKSKKSVAKRNGGGGDRAEREEDQKVNGVKSEKAPTALAYCTHYTS